MKIAFFDSKPYVQKIFEDANQGKHDLRFFPVKLTHETVELAKGFESICVFVNDYLNAAVLESLSNLGVRLIALRCKGSDNLDLKACKTHGLEAVRVPHYSPHAVAEHAVSLMLTLNRHTHKAYNRIHEGNFSLDDLVGFDMHGKTVGVIGAGDIGKILIKIMLGFGCTVLVYDLVDKAGELKDFAPDKLKLVDLDTLYVNADIISLHIPLTDENHHLINAAAIAKMKDGVMIINTSRGGLIDTQALIAGIKSKKIGHVGLDVYEHEAKYFFEDFSNSVITDDDLARLIAFPNVLITSHQAFLTNEALRDIAQTTLLSITEFEQGKRGSELSFGIR